MSKYRTKVRKVMHEYKAGTLHSGSAHGPIVRDKRKAIAIALDEGRRAAGKKRRRRPASDRG